MRKKLLNTIILFTSLIVINANATPRDNGFYTGINLGFISGIGGDYSSSEGKPKKPTPTIKIGYQHLKKNRIEFYARNNDFHKSYGLGTPNTFGINYEFGIPLFSDYSNKVLPYISIGMGKGSNNAEEVAASFGVHYKLNKHFDTTFGYQYKLITYSFSDDVSYLDEMTTKTIEVGVTYHF